MSNIILYDESHKNKLVTLDGFYEHIKVLFSRNNNIIFLLDNTLNVEDLDGVKEILNEDEIIYIPLAQRKNNIDSPLFLVYIRELESLNKIYEIIYPYFINNSNIENDKFVVCGFGTTYLDRDKLSIYFKKRTVVQDLESKIIFRWYDPRVLVHLDSVFKDCEINYILDIFNEWNFFHPEGFYSWERKYDRLNKPRRIIKLTQNQSLQLDLIEISNIVYKQLPKFENEIQTKIRPKKILSILLYAHNKYNIKKYDDLFGYGLYGCILGFNFMQHPTVQYILNRYWLTEPEDLNFTEAMNYLDEEEWSVIKNDLINIRG